MNNSLGTNIAVATCSHLPIPAVQKSTGKKFLSIIRSQVNANAHIVTPMANNFACSSLEE